MGGLIGINSTWPRDRGLLKADLNTIKESGIYRVQEGSTNTPTNAISNWGVLLSFYTNIGGAQNSSIQLISYGNGYYYIRRMWYGNWMDWQQIQTK